MVWNVAVPAAQRAGAQNRCSIHKRDRSRGCAGARCRRRDHAVNVIAWPDVAELDEEVSVVVVEAC